MMIFDPAAMACCGYETGEWGRTIATLYMIWYTFFRRSECVDAGLDGEQRGGAR
jgi:hypothetical protein